MNRTPRKVHNKQPVRSKPARSAPTKTHKRAIHTRQQPKRVTRKSPVASRTASMATGAFARTLPKRAHIFEPEKENPLVQKIKDRFFSMTFNPAYWDRNLEREILLGDKFVRDITDVKYNSARTYPSLEFKTSYYQRVNQIPVSFTEGVVEDALLLDETKPEHIAPIRHQTMPFYHLQKDGTEYKNHLAEAGVYEVGLYYTPKNKHQFPVLGLDSDYLYFHE